MNIFKAFFALTAGGLAASACLLKADGFTAGGNDAGTVADSAVSPIDGSTQTLANDDAGEPVDAATVLEAGTTDAGGTGTGPDGLPPHGPNLLANGDFELGCAGFSGNGIALTQSTIARNGTSGCQVCTTTGGGTYLGQDIGNATITPGQRYYVEVWIRGPAPGTPIQTSPPPLNLTLRNNSTSQDAPAATGGTPTATTWQRTNTLVTSALTGSVISFTMHFDGNPAVGDCVVLDDAAIYLLD